MILANQFPEVSRLKNKVWELYLLYPIDWLLALPCSMDKTIATHTKGYVRSQHWLYKPMMWCYCYHLHTTSNFARICQ